MTTGIVAFGLALAGFSALALAQNKHRRSAFAAMPPLNDGQFAAAGWALVLAALLWCVAVFQFGYGLAVLAATLTLAGWIVALVLAFRPRLAPAAFPFGVALAAAGFLWALLP